MSDPTLMLIHGLGATEGVWHEVLDKIEWPGRVLVAELPGHGRTEHTGDYTVGAMAGRVSGMCDPGEDVIVVGHSLGGAVAVCLASQFFRPVVRGVLGLGIKVSWTDDDVAAMAAIAAKGTRYFETRDEAVQRFLRGAGLAGIVDGDHPSVESAIELVSEGWMLRQDPLTFAQTKLDMAALIAAAQCSVILGAGSEDPMVSAAELSEFVSDPRIAEGAAHNVQVQDPEWVIGLLDELIG